MCNHQCSYYPSNYQGRALRIWIKPQAPLNLHWSELHVLCQEDTMHRERRADWMVAKGWCVAELHVRRHVTTNEVNEGPPMKDMRPPKVSHLDGWVLCCLKPLYNVIWMLPYKLVGYNHTPYTMTYQESSIKVQKGGYALFQGTPSSHRILQHKSLIFLSLIEICRCNSVQ